MAADPGETLISASSIKTVILLCGLPGSGKSSLAQQLVQKWHQDVVLHHIEYDALQDALHDDNKDALQAWRASRLEAIQQLCNLLELKESSVILMDDNFYLRSMRKQIWQVCRSHATHCRVYFGIIWLDTPLPICLQRNQQRQRSVDDETIVRMSQTQELPSQEISFERSSLVVKDDAKDVLDFVFSRPQKSDSLEPPIDPAIEQERLEQERQRTLNSIRHQVDQALRHCVKLVAQIDPQLAGQANQIRKELLFLQQDHYDVQYIQQAFMDRMLLLNHNNDNIAEQLRTALAKQCGQLTK